MEPAQLVLESGEIFPGFSPSWQKEPFFGEVVFSTGMTGYVESLTDPSYAGQILTFTYPLIGNYGVPSRETWESEKLQASGVVVGTTSMWTSHWDAECSFLDWLKQQGVPLITGVDTRALTKLLRKKGVALGAICREGKRPRNFPDPNKTHLVKRVSLPEKQEYGSGKKTVIAVDCGMKDNIIRSLLKYPVRVIRVPFDYDYSEDEYDGLFLSNGPGDPAVCKETVAILRKSLKRKKPIFGICLGAQLLALAIGGKTYKLKFGHRGHNQPCRDLDTNQCILTSQNHGYAIDEKTLPKDWRVLFRSLNDDSVEGIAHNKLPYFAVQFHPESHPGPTDPAYLFETFYRSL
ncbi:MAG: glutamine-hydrolyzing carbamoyl-phosphate synthase small subunit [Verrucomicrobia bacterium]|nr:glutamine-hydrolyzing carbamoyl-phosphate synthase small subunit [Verrucomicrobiota bacterium]